MSAARQFCLVCDAPSSEADHAPVPARCGGVETIPLCRGCHDLKDRYPIDSWHPSKALGAFRGLWEKADREERLMLLKWAALVSDALTTGQRGA